MKTNCYFKSLEEISLPKEKKPDIINALILFHLWQQARFSPMFCRFWKPLNEGLVTENTVLHIQGLKCNWYKDHPCGIKEF